MIKITFLLFLLSCSHNKKVDTVDNYLFLEDTKDSKTQSFITKENNLTYGKLSKDDRFAEIQKGIVSILDSDDRIPAPKVYGDYVYTTWTDKQNPQGLLRRMSFSDYLKVGVKDSLHTSWEVLLDLDLLGRKEKKTWVLKNYEISPNVPNRIFFKLSDGGKDASFLREFDIPSRKFIEKEDGGYYLDENKFYFTIIDENQINISTSFKGDYVSSSGYPLVIKRWKRGEELSSAKDVFRAEQSDLFVWDWVPTNKSIGFDSLFARAHDFYRGVISLEKDGKIFDVDIDPNIKFVSAYKKVLYFQMKKDIEEFKIGQIVSLNVDDVYKGEKLNLKLVFAPKETQSVEKIFSTQSNLYFLLSENVANKLYSFENGSLKEIDFPDHAAIHVTGIDNFEQRDDFFVYDESFLRPYGLYHIDTKKTSHKLRTKKELFDASPYITEQYWATSADGTKVPYYIIKSKTLPKDKVHPVWIYAYGGFENSMTPWYSGMTGKYWLDKGGIYVLANIRGGGEFGPRWHRQALKTNRFRTYDDYFAIAEDLISRGITAKKKIGISGGSNGGLLTGVGLTQRPDLYGAVISSAPLLDMFRYHLLPPGDSWQAEYGTVDESSELKDFWLKYSPYQALNKEKNYPPTLIMTSSSDDRVHPGHARKMSAKMKEFNKDILFFENVEGGHAMSANLDQMAKQKAMQLIFFYNNLF